LRVVRLGENRGIGAALNLGAEMALRDGASFILMSDQDSLPSPGMVASLVQLSEKLEQNGRRVGAVGPTYTDVHTERVFPFQTREGGALFYKHRHPGPEGIVKALSLITSGTLIPAHVLRDVGPMHEGLFIDYVDVEWCLRAVSRGYEFYGSAATTMFQRLGDRSLGVWYLRWRKETRYPPLRIYYRVRNHIALCRLRYIPLGWKLRASWYVAGVVYSHIVFGDERMASLSMALRGGAHGVLGRLGRLGEG
jgi:rhamnosyltransferase